MLRRFPGRRFNPGNDPLFSSVVSLVHFNGTNGSTTVPDSKTGTNWACTSPAALTTAQSKFGTASGSFIGPSTSAIMTPASVAGFNLGTGDFTLEMFIKLNSNISMSFYGQNISVANGLGLYYSTGNGIRLFLNSANVLLGVIQLSTSVFKHVAAVRSGNNFSLFIDGVADGTGTNSSSISNADVNLGNAGNNVAVNNVDAFIDEFRLTKAVRYTGAFTPPSAEFPNF